MSDTFSIVRAHPSLITYVDSLQRKYAEELSFYPRQVFEREAERGRIFLGLLNGEPCGYIYAGAQSVDVKCHQVAIQYDVRRRLYGAQLVQALEDYAVEGGACSVTLRCGFDLEANAFWRSLGYECIGIHDGGIRRMRRINVWRKQFQPMLFDFETFEPAEGKRDARVWARHKKTGIEGITAGFARGRALKQYREIILRASREAIDDEELE